MLIFRNPGLIDLRATTTLGVSVKREGSFGFFGTGFKFAVATVLRGGGEVYVYRGTNAHQFKAEPTTIRDEQFDIVTLDGDPLGFTTQLGRNWEPWMALRELGCNARDEHGEFWQPEAEFDVSAIVQDDYTTIAVIWPEIDQAYKQRASIFVDYGQRELLYEDESLRIFAGTSDHVFYRGVRAHKLQKPSVFTYDLLKSQILTEDRTIASTWNIDGTVAAALRSMDDQSIIRPALAAGDGYFEGKLNYETAAATTSRGFIDAATAAREAGELRNDTARKTLLRHIRKAAAEEQRGVGYVRYRTDAFSYAVERLAEIGVEFPEDQEFITVPELPGEAMTTYEAGRIYVLDALTRSDARAIAEQLLYRWVDKTVEGYDQEAVTRLLAPLLLDRISAFKRAKAMLAEDDGSATAEQVDEVLAEA